MALAKLSPTATNTNLSTDFDIEENTLFYGKDILTVLQQQDIKSCGLAFVRFRDQDIPVFAAKSINNRTLSLAALPCPPYYHDDIPEARVGNILTDFTETA